MSSPDSSTGSSGGGPTFGGAAGGVVGVIVGFAIGFIVCWYTLVRDLNTQLAAREASMHQWEELTRIERERIELMKGMSVNEIQRWVAERERGNVEYAKLQAKLHNLEVALTGPATAYIILAGIVVLAAVALVVLLVRASHSAAATTLENIVALAPEQMVKTALLRAIAAQKGLTITLDDQRDDDGESRTRRKISGPERRSQN